MSNPSYVNEIDAITMALQNYIEGARTGKSAAMKPAFHEGATIFGYDGEEFFGGPIQGLYDWHDQNGPARDIQARLSAIDVVGHCANVRMDIDNWTGHRFTDFLNLVKFEGHWKIVSKVYHMHP
jgi:hypothetical protein